MLAMYDQWSTAFRAAGDIGRLRHQPGPIGVAMISTGFVYIWLVGPCSHCSNGAMDEAPCCCPAASAPIRVSSCQQGGRLTRLLKFRSHALSPPRLRLLLQLLLTLNATDGVAADGTPSTTDSFIILLPGFFAALLILGVDEVARWVVLAVVNEPTGRL